jgi:PAS domain S-box-containing protein
MPNPSHIDTTNHLLSIANSTSDALIAINSEGKVISWNNAAESIFHYSKDEMMGQSLHAILPERFREMHDKGIARVNSGGERHVIGKAVQLAGRRKDGSEFPLELTLSAWSTKEGMNYGGIIRDITDRVAMEDEIRSSEMRFRSILDSAHDAIITADSKGMILSWNRAAMVIFGHTAEEVLGKPLTIIVPEEYRTLHEQGVSRVSGGGEHHVMGKMVELSGLHKHGHLIPIELSLSTWLIGDNRYYSGIIRDISERKLNEELRLATEMKFKSIAESANDAIISADSKGMIQSWNKAAENIFGYTEREVLGGPLTIIVPDKYKALHDEGIKRVGQGGKRHVIGNTVELTGLHKNGKEFPLELSLSAWEVNNQMFYSGIIRDITKRKEDEEKLKSHQRQLAEKAQQLEKLNQEVSSKNEQLQGLSNKLAKYLSRQVYTNIFEGKRDVKIESYRKKLTIFFSDIEGFTELTERVESEVLTSVLNKYLNEMSKIALEHGGTIDKYIGDAIMIFFGDPESLGEKEDAIACVKMAIEMNKRLQEMRLEWDVLGISTPLRIRMGVNTGFCTVGNFGSDERLDYTIVGGAVNLANRLESAANTDEILISEDTFSLVKDVIKCKARGQIDVKGFAYPVNSYVVIGEIEKLKEEEEQLSAQLNGFNLSINYDKLNYSDKMYAKELLMKAMSKLED